jgi:hypothetical protein
VSNVVIDIVTQFSGKKAFKDADNAAAKLTGTVKRLGAAFGLSLGGAAVLRFAKSSAKAFIEDEKAATRLTQSVKNLGLAYATNDIVKYIDQLTLATGVADSELRPALQSLLQVTGSVTKSQELLATAINTSRGSGESLTTVANDLSQAYVGNLKGLRKYYLGLTQAELKAMSFADVQERLNSTFSGASAAYLRTYAGQMQLLANTANEAKEVIGKDLISALIMISGDTSVEGLAGDMQDFAEYTGNAIYGVGVLIDKINSIPVLPNFSLEGIVGAIPILGGYINLLVDLAKSDKAGKNTFNFASGGGAGTGDTSRMSAKAAAAAELAAKKRQADLLKMQKASLKAQQDALKLKKAGTLFDIEQAGIIAALKGEVSKEDEARLKLQFAILTGNVSEASKLAGEVAKAQGLTKALVEYYSGIPNAKNPFEGWIKTLLEVEAASKRIADENKAAAVRASTFMGVSISADQLAADPAKYADVILADSERALAESEAVLKSLGIDSPNAAPNVSVTVTLDGQELTGVISKVQTNNYLSGKIIALERILGSFN